MTSELSGRCLFLSEPSSHNKYNTRKPLHDDRTIDPGGNNFPGTKPKCSVDFSEKYPWKMHRDDPENAEIRDLITTSGLGPEEPLLPIPGLELRSLGRT